MKRLLMILAGSALMAPAFAANEIDLSGLNFRVGGIYPFESTTRRVTGNMFSIGLDLPLSFQGAKGGELYISADWFLKSIDGKKGNIVPILLNQKIYLVAGQGEGSRSYGFVGLGFAHVDVTKSRTTYAGRVGLGREINRQLFVEGSFLFTSEANNARGDSFGVFLGYKF